MTTNKTSTFKKIFFYSSCNSFVHRTEFYRFKNCKPFCVSVVYGFCCDNRLCSFMRSLAFADCCSCIKFFAESLFYNCTSVYAVSYYNISFCKPYFWLDKKKQWRLSYNWIIFVGRTCNCIFQFCTRRYFFLDFILREHFNSVGW